MSLEMATAFGCVTPLLLILGLTVGYVLADRLWERYGGKR